MKKQKDGIVAVGENGRYVTTEYGQTEQSPIKRYWERPAEFENFTLYQLNLTHKFNKGQWKKWKK